MFVKFVVLLVLMFFGSHAQANGKISLFVFGDSLSDVGNDYIVTNTEGVAVPIPPAGRYYNGRFSNGPNAVDYLWEIIGDGSSVKPVERIADVEINKQTQALSFAYGGSETGLKNSVLGQFEVIGLLGQIDMFRALKGNHKHLKHGIALVWSGANDYINQYANGEMVSEADVISRLKIAILGLYCQGVRNFLVPNLPDLGEIPLAYILSELYSDIEIPRVLSKNTSRHNTKLDKLIRDLRRLPGVNIRKVDIYSLVKNIVLNRGVVSGPASGCLFSPIVDEEACSPISFEEGDGLIFWDEIHPTTELHRAFADEILKELFKGLFLKKN
ncbi:SGNH/GDSL hydrolase family protein [Methylomonas sp. HYX-M1]|uniref:SGNH/GDSL hydrolase family protein n=1 Tax=Methylomonas sp. HYX-M1 TaxID=3139307 RepID=UPI00345C28CF